jgi:hypothetical protein
MVIANVRNGWRHIHGYKYVLNAAAGALGPRGVNSTVAKSRTITQVFQLILDFLTKFPRCKPSRCHMKFKGALRLIKLQG